MLMADGSMGERGGGGVPSGGQLWSARDVATSFRAGVQSGSLTECRALGYLVDTLVDMGGIGMLLDGLTEMTPTPNGLQKFSQKVQFIGAPLLGVGSVDNHVELGSWGGDVDNGYRSRYKDDARRVQHAFPTLGPSSYSGGNNNDQSHRFAFYSQLAWSAGSSFSSVAQRFFDRDGGDRDLGLAIGDMVSDLRSGALSLEELGSHIIDTICK